MKQVLVTVPEEDATDALLFQEALNASLRECPDGYWEYTVKAKASPEIENLVMTFEFSQPSDPEAEPNLVVIATDTYTAQFLDQS